MSQQEQARLSIEDALYRFISIQSNTLTNLAAATTQLNNLMNTFLNIIEQQQIGQQQSIPQTEQQQNKPTNIQSKSKNN